MLHPILQRKLSEIVEARSAIRLRWANVLLIGVAAVFLIAVCAQGRLAHERFFTVMLLLAAYLVVGGYIAKLWARSKLDVHQLSREIETRHPELQAVLLTAIEQQPGGAGFSYLQKQVIDEAVTHAARQMWAGELTAQGNRRSSLMRVVALVMIACGYGWFVSQYFEGRSKRAPAVIAAAAPTMKAEAKTAFELSVTPGDTEVEKGTRLIVEAKFATDVPADATIIVSDANGGESRRVPMRLTVDQQVFGGMIAKIDRDSVYRVEFGAGKSDDYKITTFIHPELVRADAKITPPAYTGLPVKEIKNTLKVTALEGSDVAFQFKVNKPVASAELFGEDKTIIPLKARADDPTILEASIKPETSQKYRLHLVDDKERSNKQPPWITVNVQANQLAKIEVQFPKRDVQVSSLQELPVEAKVWDDLGVQKSGAVFSLMGKSKEVMLSTKPLEAVKKHDVRAQFNLENESAEPRQLVSYYFWAEDTGPKGEVRRAMSDMFFADVRHFEDIFREKEAPPSEPGPPKKGQADKLVELQKQIVNATWRLVRDTNAGKEMENVVPDVIVVKQSEEMAMEQVKEAMEKAEDAEVKTALTEAWKSMKDAVTPLEQAADEKKRGPLNQALIFEQAALEWLYRTASREHQVVRKDPKSKGAGEQKNEGQIMNLELKQKEQRYEEEKDATPEQSAEQQENLQVLNRLKELARRQEALAEKMKELEKQIGKAKTEEEKQELANQLKRLQDEQEQLLRDVDDLKEKMEKSENQATMAESKEQLEKTREQVVDAAEKLKEEKMAQAANSATRAQRELEQMQEDFRKKTARRFGDEMKQLKQQAREAGEEQKKIADTLENQKSNDKPGDTSNSLEKLLTGAETARQLDAQKERVTKLMEDMRRISEQAEGVEPLLSQSLYDTVRKAHTSGVEENLEETRLYARMGERQQAQDAERKATKAVDDLQKGVDKAAESVLGSESDALRMARAELDSLIKGVKAEDAETGRQGDKEKQQANAGGEKKPGDQAKDGKGEKPGESGKGEGKAGDESKDAKTADAGKGKPSPDGKGQGKAEDEGKGEGKGEAGEKPGDQPGKGGQGKDAQTAEGKRGEKGEQPGQEGQSGKPGGQGTGDPQGQPQNAQASAGEGKDGQGQNLDGKGGAEGQPQNGQLGQTEPSRPMSPNNQARNNTGSRTSGGGGGGGDDGGLFFEGSDQMEDTSPLTGNAFEQWSDRLRNVEELLNAPELRNEAARVLDNARALRADYRRSNEAPKATNVTERITAPLVELRDRVAEELAKRESGNNLAPVDRDPVPQQYRELVRKYYQQLGAGK